MSNGYLDLYKAERAVPSKRIWVVDSDGNQSLEPWQGVQELGAHPVDFTQSTYYTLPYTHGSAPFTIGEEITAGKIIGPFLTHTGSFDNAGETVLFADFLIILNMAGGTYAVGDIVTGSVSGATGVVVYYQNTGSQDVIGVRTTNNIQFAIPDVVATIGGVTGDFAVYQNSNIFLTMQSVPFSATGTSLAFEANIYDLPNQIFVYGLTSHAEASDDGANSYNGGKQAMVVADTGSVLTIQSMTNLNQHFIPNNQIVGSISGSTALSGTETLLTARDQHFVLAGGTEFILTAIFLANNSQIFSGIGDVFIYDQPNRGGNLIVQFTIAELNAALTDTTNSFILAGVGGGVQLSNYAKSKTVGKDLYLSMNVPSSTPLTADIRFIGYITH